MKYFRENVVAMQGYVPGEQPQTGDIIKLNTNENPYPCSPKVKAEIGRAIQRGLEKYPDPAANDFREQASKLLDVPSDWILCGNGSDDILTIITRAMVGPGNSIRFAQPSYVLYKTLAEIQGAQCEVVNYQPDWTLGDDFTEPSESLRLAYLANPNSPSGTIIPPDEVAKIADALPCPLLVDEAYGDFASINCLDLVAKNEKIMVSRTLSKSYSLAGLRFGYLIAQPQIIEQLAKVKDSYNCDTLSIAGATAAIGDQNWFQETRNNILNTRGVLLEKLRELGFECVDSEANFVWCKHPQHASQEIYDYLKASNILVRYMSYPNWGDGLRITVGTDEQIEVLLNQLAKHLEKS